MYLLDTDIIIDFQNKKDPGFTYFQTAIKKESFISVISYSEIVLGMQKFSYRQTMIQKFDKMLNDLGLSSIPIENRIGIKYAELKHYLREKRNLLPDFDLLIAASAIASGLTLVTRNIKHFSRIPDLKLYRQK